MERAFHFFHYKQATLHYSIYGSGSIPLLCFHGFGLTGHSFFEIEEVLASEYRIYNFDLFYHGKSAWKEDGKPMSESFLQELISEFTRANSISTFSLLGYSIGARLVWSIAKKNPEKVKEIIVIAPDGILISVWYYLATGSVCTRAIFKWLLAKGSYLKFFLAMGHFLNSMSASTVRFIESQLRSEAQRKRVYDTWLVYRALKSEPKLNAALFNKHNTKVTVFLGKQDQIITYKKVSKLTNFVSSKFIIHLEAGHSTLLPAVVAYLKRGGF